MRRLAVLPAVLGIVLFAAILVLGQRVDSVPWRDELPSLAVMLALVLAGAFLAGKLPRNPIGWLFVMTGLSVMAYGVIILAVTLGGPRLMWVAWVGNWVWVPGNAGLLFTLLLFPDGRPPSPRWRPVVVASLVTFAALLVAVALHPRLEVAPELRNPLGVPFAAALGEPLIACMLLLQLVAVVSLVLRFLRSRGPERQQLKWVAYGATALAVLTIASIAGVGPYWVDALGSAVLLGSIVVAVLRYRLYDIDRLINRTVVYAILTALLAATYLAAVTVLQRALDPLTGESQLAVAASTLAVAALFRPLRRRVQETVDRRFNRRRYDATRTVEAFRGTLRDAVDLDVITRDLLAAVTATVAPRGAALVLLRPVPRPTDNPQP